MGLHNLTSADSTVFCCFFFFYLSEWDLSVCSWGRSSTPSQQSGWLVHGLVAFMFSPQLPQTDTYEPNPPPFFLFSAHSTTLTQHQGLMGTKYPQMTLKYHSDFEYFIGGNRVKAQSLNSTINWKKNKFLFKSTHGR